MPALVARGFTPFHHVVAGTVLTVILAVVLWGSRCTASDAIASAVVRSQLHDFAAAIHAARWGPAAQGQLAAWLVVG